VSEELRNLAVEKNCVLVTAAQLNRGAVEEVEFDHSHISGGLSKIQTADNVIGIFTSRAMKERGRYQVQFMKTRSSSGVGQKVDLEFDIDSLRIKDLGEEEESSFNQQRSAASSALIDGLKKTSVVTATNVDPETGEIDPTKGSSLPKSKQLPQQRNVRDILSSFSPEKD
jgi:hypothetical protein